MVRAPTSSTGCEVMRPSRLHAKDGLTLRIQTPKEMRNAKMNERGKDHRGSQERARARSLVTVYPAAGRQGRFAPCSAALRPASRVTRQRPVQNE